MKFLDLFSGIGGFRSGLEKAGHQCVGYVEIDKYARKSYEAIYDTKGQWTAYDVRTVRANEIPKADIWCFGFPCQDISLAGKQKGFSGNRSSLFFVVTRIIRSLEEKDRPTFLLIENVKNLLSVNKGFDFAKLLVELDEIGYDAEWDVLDTAEVLPQHRERVYIVGHFRERSTRQVFPIRNSGIQNFGQPKQNSNTVTAGYSKAQSIGSYIVEGQSAKVKQVGNISAGRSYGGNPQAGRVYDSTGISPSLNTMQGGSREPKILVINNTKKGYLEATAGDGVDLAYVEQNTRRGRVQHQRTNTLTNSDSLGTVVKEDDQLRIRKLTPLECWRLQGFTDSQFYKAQAVNSNSQLYKQAGNSVSVPVVYEVARRLELLK